MVKVSNPLRAGGIILGAILLFAPTAATVADSVPTSCDYDSGIPSGFCASSTPGGMYAGAWRVDNDRSSPQQGSSSSNVADQRDLKTAEGVVDPTAASYAGAGACQFFCVWGLEVGGDSVGVGGGELGEGLFPVGGGASLDEACGGCSFVGGFAGVCEALGGSFVFDVADGEP